MRTLAILVGSAVLSYALLFAVAATLAAQPLDGLSGGDRTAAEYVFMQP